MVRHKPRMIGRRDDEYRKTYKINKEVYISLRKGDAEPGETYLVTERGKNIKLIPSPVPDPLVDAHRYRKVRKYKHRSLCIALPPESVPPDQVFRIIKMNGAIWLLRVEEFLVYADETSLPPEVVRVL